MLQTERLFFLCIGHLSHARYKYINVKTRILLCEDSNFLCF